MSADLLRRAAAKMRAHAEAASYDGFPWVAKPHHARRNCATVQTRGEEFLAHYVQEGNAEHIASWHPLVAFAVADWLDHAASRAESKVAHGGKVGPVWSHERDAITVARAYLGEVADA